MSVFRLPNSEKQIIQSNEGDYKGNLWGTFNIDLDSDPGVIKTAPRLEKAVGADTWGTDDIVQALQLHDGNYYIATNQTVADCSVNADPRNEGNWGTIATLGAEDLGLETDMTSFAGLLLISLGTNIMSWEPVGEVKDNDWWTATTSGSALTANFPHTLQVLRTGQDTLFVTDKNLIRYYNTTAGHTTITLDTLMVANTLTPSLDKMWAGTYTEVENNAYIYEIAVGNTAATQAYAVDGRACLSLFTYKNTPFVVTEKGYIQAFNGAGFETIAQFPFALESKVMDGARPGQVQSSPTALAIHPKGIGITGKYAYIFVDANDEFNTGTLLNDRTFSGVWVLDLETYSLTHKYALTLETTDYGISKVTRSGPLLITGTPETRIMVGSEVDTIKGVWMEGTEQPQGFFITTRHESDSFRDAFETAITKTDTLADTESVTVKYKDDELPSIPYLIDDITWLNATSFTTTDTTISDAMVGYEVFILAGYQAGKMCHIVSVTGGTTKTVIVDEPLGTLNELSDVQIENWTKINQNTENEIDEATRLGASEHNTHFRQHKVVMKGNVKLREFISKSNSKEEL